MQVLVFFAACILLVFHAESAILCAANTCASLKCSNPYPCEGKNKIVEKGGFCGCCDECKTIVDECEQCAIFDVIGGPPPPLVCKKGHSCYNGICQSDADIRLGKQSCKLLN